MNQFDDNSRTQQVSTDELLSDYLNDVWGGDLASSIVEKEKLISDKDEREPLAELFSCQAGYKLIPTINIQHFRDGQIGRTQEESLIILLTNLYFLRRPLSPRVRQCFLDLSEQVIDDYQAAQWLKPVAGRSELSET